MSSSEITGDCPIFRLVGISLVKHHCHLQDAIADGIRSVLLPILGRYESNQLFGRRATWTADDRVTEVVRFAPSLICRTCNEVDGCLLGDRPGPYFSLAPNEIREVRKVKDPGMNAGSVFILALAEARRSASRFYFERAPLALPLGKVIANERLERF